MKALAELLFWIHLPFFLAWFGLFLVPQAVWPARIAFHFWFVVAMVASELITGAALRSKMPNFRIVCPLTAAMQRARGFAFDDPRNYGHSFVRESFERIGIPVPRGLVGALIFISLGVVAVQYALVVGVL